VIDFRSVDFRWAPPSTWTLICRPDDPHKSLVREDGALLYGFHAHGMDHFSFDTVLELSAQTAHRPTGIIQRTESPRRPIVETVITYPDQTLRLTVFAHERDGERVDVVLWSITAGSITAESTFVASLHVDAYLRGRALVGVGDAPIHDLYAVPAEPLVGENAWMDDIPRVAALDPDAGPMLRSTPHAVLGVHATGFRPATGLCTAPVALRPGESVEGALVVPLGGAVVAGWDLDRARAALEHERAFWDKVEISRLAIEVPDADVQDMLVACARNILQAREVEDGLPVLHVGPTIYRGLWLVDGHFLIEAARYLGLDEVADAGVEVLLRRVNPDGSVSQLEEYPYLKETGIAITTLVRQCELSGDVERLRRHWPTVTAAVAHIERLRAAAYELPPDHPSFGLLPEGFGDGGIGGTRSEYTNVLWTLIGLRYATEGARLVGAAGDQARFGKLYDGLRADFDRSAREHRRPLPDGSGDHLPMLLPGSGTHHFVVGVPDEDVPPWRQAQPETATWALCHAVHPGEVFAPDDPTVCDLLQLFDRRDDEQGIPATTGWLPFNAVWTYAAAFAAQVWLWAGRPDKAVDYLYAFANHAAPTRMWREEQSLAASGLGHICGDMPHNWASAEFIRLVRHLLLFERGDTLEILPGAPAHWTEPGTAIRLERSPTRFGRVSVTTDCGEHRFVARIVREAGSELVTAWLTVPERFRTAVSIDGVPTAIECGRVVLRLQPGDAITVEACAYGEPL
jgi:hypothetical protein